MWNTHWDKVREVKLNEQLKVILVIHPFFFEMQRARVTVSAMTSCLPKTKLELMKVRQWVSLTLSVDDWTETALPKNATQSTQGSLLPLHRDGTSVQWVQMRLRCAAAPLRIHPALVGSPARASADAVKQTSKWSKNLASLKLIHASGMNFMKMPKINIALTNAQHCQLK